MYLLICSILNLLSKHEMWKKWHWFWGQDRGSCTGHTLINISTNLFQNPACIDDWLNGQRSWTHWQTGATITIIMHYRTELHLDSSATMKAGSRHMFIAVEFDVKSKSKQCICLPSWGWGWDIIFKSMT